MVDLGELWLKHPKECSLEKDVSEDLLERLRKHFHIDQEVNGTHFSGKRVRIDAVLVPRDRSCWAGDTIHIGLEIKRGKDSIGEASKQAAQAVDYSHSYFDKYGYLFIFCWPDPTHGVFGSRSGFYQRFLGQLGVGFLRNNCGSLELHLKGHLVWSEKLGPVDARRWKLERKFGSR